MKTPREYAKELEAKMQCNCDLDNWEPERSTGHSCVCRIHKQAHSQALNGANEQMTICLFRGCYGTAENGGYCGLHQRTHSSLSAEEQQK